MNVSALDFTLGLRMLWRYPGITAIGTVAMAVAIALGMLYFEGLTKGLHPTLPVANGDRIVTVRYWDIGKRRVEERSLHDFAMSRTNVKTIEQFGAALVFTRNVVTEDHQVEPVRGAEVTANAFTLMGMSPLVGRTLTARDEQPAEPLAAVIGERLWTTRFARDPSAVGRSVKVGTADATIVGVMPERFGFPVNQHLWLPLRTDGSLLAPRTGPPVTLFGRLAPAYRCGRRRRNSTASPPDWRRPTARPTRTCSRGSSPTGRRRSKATRPIIKNVLYAANTFFLLLLAVICTNVATLVFARTATRGWEVAVRNALGASRGRIVAQLFTEALVLTAVAAGLGIALAKLALRWGVRVIGADALPFWITDSLSTTTLLYAGLLTLVATVIVGVLPALRVTRLNVQDGLRREQAASANLRFGGVWTTVIVVQVAITVASIPLAAVLVIASNRFHQRAEGIAGADRYLTAAVTFDRQEPETDAAAAAARGRRSLADLERRLRAEPGVEQVAFGDRLPVMDTSKYSVEVDTATGAPTTGLRWSTFAHVSPGFFAAFGSAVVAGRNFSPVDLERGNVLIVNQSFTRLVFGDHNPVGQRIRIAHSERERSGGRRRMVRGRRHGQGCRLADAGAVRTGGHVSSGAAPARHERQRRRAGPRSDRLRVAAARAGKCRGPRDATDRRATAERRRRPRGDAHVDGDVRRRFHLPAGAAALGLRHPRPDVVHRRAPDAGDRHSRGIGRAAATHRLGDLHARVPAGRPGHPRRQRRGGAEDRLRIRDAGADAGRRRRGHADRGTRRVHAATPARAQDQSDGRAESRGVTRLLLRMQRLGERDPRAAARGHIRRQHRDDDQRDRRHRQR